jgi:hypothetical protein
MVVKYCQRCGAQFVPKFPTAKLCYHCWLEREQALERVDLLEQEVATLRAALAKAQPAPAIPRDMRRLLVQLCHPDRHGGSEAANKATRWLLSLPKGA